MGIYVLFELMKKLSYSFTDPALLNTALTHSSYVKGENRASTHNERMEFLGDAVLELCVSEYLYLNYPHMNEGMMTRTRSRAVYEHALYEAAKIDGANIGRIFKNYQTLQISSQISSANFWTNCGIA